MLERLVARTTLMKALYQPPDGNVCSFDEHAAIVEAMAQGDSERATELMDRHLQDSEGKLKREPEREVNLLQLFRRPAAKATRRAR
jgi:DNA-binding GntR family transcriptional regulator